MDNDQTLNKSLEYNFEIKPPFWQSWWFYGVCIVSILIISIAYTRYRTLKLEKDKEKLEDIVAIRTEEVVIQKDEIVKQRDEILHQKQEITDSIQYAEQIQKAILPIHDEIVKDLADFTILFKPKDIVSGDFYWLGKSNGKIIITVADCTGHGVPGAFMSMLGMSFLDEIVNKDGITQANVILNELRGRVIAALKQSGKSGTSKDGMDMAICTVDVNAMKLQYAGANNSLYFIRDNQLKDIKADKMPVAIYEKMDPFNNHEFDLKQGDTFFMFSDGYADQFGGVKGKKFKYKPFKKLLLDHHQNSLSEVSKILDTKIEEWKSHIDPVINAPFEQIDDICIGGFRV